MSLPPAGREWIQRDKNPAERLQINGETLEVAGSHNMLCKYHFFPAYNTSNTSSWTVRYVVLKKRIKINSMEGLHTYCIDRYQGVVFLFPTLASFFLGVPKDI